MKPVALVSVAAAFALLPSLRLDAQTPAVKSTRCLDFAVLSATFLPACQTTPNVRLGMSKAIV